MEKEQSDFLVITGEELLEKMGLKDSKVGDPYILEITSREEGKVVLNFVKLGGSK